MNSLKIFVLLIFSVCSCTKNHLGTAYYFDNINGEDENDGKSAEQPLKSLSVLTGMTLNPGDQILLATGQSFNEPLVLKNQHGSFDKPIIVSSFGENEKQPFAYINVKDHENGLLIENGSFIEVSQLDITAGRGTQEVEQANAAMRCGILVKNSTPGEYKHIYLSKINVHDVFYEQEGYQRPMGEVRTANGTQSYGWGIRFISTIEEAYFKDIKIDSSHIENVAHTGIKLTGRKHKHGYSIEDVQISNTKVMRTGGPGIQMSEIKDGHIFGNEVDHSGSDDDSRKWGRGSGLWTWESSDILIEKNRFTNANGPGDSAGAHIDFNCQNVVIQYNFSANNAGGFCEILGNNYNCAYRYNISVNDGYRVKGQNGAFQEGKIFWLSGYAGAKKERKGPFNSYFYNNTIVVSNAIEAKIAIDRVADGVLIANNIFHIQGVTKSVKGDQYKPESEGDWKVKDVFFSNNLILHTESWPINTQLQDANPSIGNPDFVNIYGLNISDYVPLSKGLLKDKGIMIPKLTNDSIGLIYGLKMGVDILGNKITGRPDLGAIEVQN